ncbi:P4H3 [Scenedesmus sp. PABB004]|nr:P4H3 [Scenedesmus sp. PABB004]
MRRRGLPPLLLLALLAAAAHRGAGGDREADAQDEDFVGWRGESFEPADTFAADPKSQESWVELLSWEPRAYLYHGFAAHWEADHLIELVRAAPRRGAPAVATVGSGAARRTPRARPPARPPAQARPHVKKSEVVDSDTGEFMLSKERTSSGAFLRRGQTDVVASLERRLAEWTMLPVENGEPFHILHYQEGEEYTPHFDYFFESKNTENGGQRIATALLYLSDVDEGGETVFPDSKKRPTEEEKAGFSVCGQAGLAVKPRKGDCLLFWSLRPDGVTKDTFSLHAGCPVCPSGQEAGKKCNKWSATKWIRVGEHKDWGGPDA